MVDRETMMELIQSEAEMKGAVSKLESREKIIGEIQMENAILLRTCRAVKSILDILIRAQTKTTTKDTETTLNPSEQKSKGMWIMTDVRDHYRCSECQWEGYVPTCMGEPLYKHCPNCRAKMMEE